MTTFRNVNGVDVVEVPLGLLEALRKFGTPHGGRCICGTCDAIEGLTALLPAEDEPSDEEIRCWRAASGEPSFTDDECRKWLRRLHAAGFRWSGVAAPRRQVPGQTCIDGETT